MFQFKSESTSSKAHYLPFATQLTQLTHISKFAGKTAGIDIFHWINKAIRVPKINSATQPSSNSFLDPIYQRIYMLLHYNITPVFVFDGWILPKKLPQILRRYRMRMERQREGMRYINAATELSIYLQIIQEEEQNNLQFIQQQELLHEQPYEEPIVQGDIGAEVTDAQGQIQQPQEYEIEQNMVNQSQKEQNIAELNKEPQYPNEANPEDNIDRQAQSPEPVMQAEPVIQPQGTEQTAEVDIIQTLLQEWERLSNKGHKLLAQSTGLSEYNIAKTMEALLGLGYDNFIVAPYEADPQLVKLKHTGKIDFIISEDGDYLIHEVPTVFKLGFDGNCQFIDLSSHRNSQRLDSILPALKQFTELSYVEKAEVAALCGTDYFKGVGAEIKTVVRRYIECKKDMLETIRTMRSERSYMNKIHPNHQKHALEVKMILLHQMVYDQGLNAIDYLHPFNPLSGGVTEEYLAQIVGPFYQYTDDIRTGKKKNRTPFIVRNLTPMVPPPHIILDVEALQEKEREYNQQAKNGPVFKQLKQKVKKTTNNEKQKASNQQKQEVHNQLEKKKAIHKNKSTNSKKVEKKQSQVKPPRQTLLTKAAVGTKSILSFFKKEPALPQKDDQIPKQEDDPQNKDTNKKQEKME